MKGGADGEEERLDYSAIHFAAWYRGQVQGNLSLVADTIERLRNVLPGFRSLNLIQKSTEYRELVIEFNGSRKNHTYRFDKISDGQRMLILLYMLLFGDSPNRTLLIDEPDNYMTLPEIQPLLANLYECGGSLPQVVLISHHPEAIDFLGESAVWLKRDPEGPTRTIPATEVKNETMLRNSELYARRWIP